MEQSKPQVAVIGLGIMGAGMAHNLLKAGYPLSVYNRSRAKAEPFAALGAQVAASPREAAAHSEVVLSMVGDDEASRAIWLGEDGALTGARPGTALVECSTLSLPWVRELGGLATERGLYLLDAPVTGSKEAAQNGTLRLLVGGDKAALDRVQPMLKVISQEAIYMGPTASGALMKLINNLMGAVQAVNLAEALLLAERGGLDVNQVVDLLMSGAGGSPIVKGKARRMAGREYEDTHFALRWMHKDATYALRAADEAGVPLPTVATAREVYRLARNLGFDDADFAAVIEALRPNRSNPDSQTT